MKKQNRDSISYNPYKKNAGIAIPILVVTSIVLDTMALIAHFSSHPLFISLLVSFQLITIIIAVVLTIITPEYSTTATIDNNGISITFSGKAEPIFIPWSKDVYINICLEKDSPKMGEIIRSKVLCLSNINADEELVLCEDSVNFIHKLPTDDYAPWFVFLVVSTSKLTCKREAKRVLAFKEAALAKK